MSIINILTRKTPTIAGIEFDAVLEDVFESEVQLTEYPIEIGASASDHAIILPKRVTMSVAVSNNPVRVQLTDFVGAASFIDTNSGLLAAGTGVAAGFLAGSDESRAGAALEALVALQASRQEFDLDCVDIQLNNMMIRKITRPRNTETEGGLVALVEMQEFPKLSTVLNNNAPDSSDLNANDPSATQAVSEKSLGEKIGGAVTSAVESAVNTVAGIF